MTPATINIIPPVPIAQPQSTDISTLMGIIVTLSSVLNNAATYNASGTTYDPTTIASLNNTITDASDRIDVTINPTVAF